MIDTGSYNRDQAKYSEIIQEWYERFPSGVTLPADRTGGARPSGPGNEVALPLWGHGREIGRIVVVLPRHSVGVDIPADDRLLAVALIDQLGAVLAPERGLGGGAAAGPA